MFISFINLFNSVIFWFMKCNIIVDTYILQEKKYKSNSYEFFTQFFYNLSYETIEILNFIILSLVTIVFILINVAFYTLAERKIMAAVQRRSGPSVVGFIGLLQPIADGLKLILKEIIIPTKANSMLFIIAPFLAITITFVNWMLISFSWADVLVDLNLSLLVLFTISSFNIYSIIISGWASNSRYPFLGALRAASQMISYEVSLTVIFLCVVLCSGSFNLIKIVAIQEQSNSYCFAIFPIFVIFIISILAETNRAPFDLPEAEAEIVAGYNLEYSSMAFALFFLGEYGNMILMSALTTILFLGGWGSYIISYYLTAFNVVNLWFVIFTWEVCFAIKTIFIAFCFVLVRATFPRLRYDQLMLLGWTVFLPISTAFFIFLLALKISFSSFQSITLNILLYYWI
jgi:NADH-quinone oxidoreductase subunit H